MLAHLVATPFEAALPWQVDARADDGARDVSFDRAAVVIARSLRGVRMRVRLATRAYRGVVLSLGEAGNGRAFYRISLWHADRDFSVTLHEAFDDADIVAEWKRWAAYFSLPKFIEREPGHLEGAEAWLGETQIGRARAMRRRGATISKRRARAPMRRKMGDSARANTVHRPERLLGNWEARDA